MNTLLGNRYLDHNPLTIPNGAHEGPFLAPKLAPTLVARSAEIAELRDHLTSGVRSVALSPVHGLSGLGLRTLVAAACYDEAVCATFSGGVLWADVTRDPAAVLAEWGEALGVSDRAGLREALAGRRVLIVLAGATDPRQLAPFALGGPRATNLVTTTHAGIAARAAVRRTVGVLHPDHAVDVLQEWANDEDAPRQTVSMLAWRLGYQALPLALVGAMVPVLGGWRRTLEAVDTQRVDLSLTQKLNPAERLTQIYALFNLCFATLSQREQAHTRTLATLSQRGAPLTLAAIGGALDYDISTPEGESATQRATNALRRRAILDYAAWRPMPTLRMHPLLVSYCLTV